MKSKFRMLNLNEIRINIEFYIAITISFLLSILFFLHPSNLKAFNEFGNFKWILIILGLFGFTFLILVSIFGYVFMAIYSIKSIIKKIKEKRIISSLGTIFQFLFVIALTWPIPLSVVRIYAKLYFNFIIPDLL